MAPKMPITIPTTREMEAEDTLVASGLENGFERGDEIITCLCQ